MDPYLLLQVSEQASDDAIKTAYLTAIQTYPPEKHPALFEALRTAYEAIATKPLRLKHQLLQQIPADRLTALYAALESQVAPSYSEPLACNLVLTSAQCLVEGILDKL